MLYRKLNSLFLFPLHILGSFQFLVLFLTCNFLFLASFTHILISTFCMDAIFPLPSKPRVRRMAVCTNNIVMLSHRSSGRS